MFSLDDFIFAYKYPFSELARKITKANSFSLQNIPESIKERAFIRIKRALDLKPYIQQNIEKSKSIMLDEILSFSLAKILIALTKNETLKQRFAESTASACFFFLEKEKEKQALIEILSNDLKLNICFDLNEKKFRVPLNEFVSVSFLDKQLFLVNQQLEQGNVFMDLNAALRFISKSIYLHLLNSFSFDLNEFPKELHLIASQLIKSIEKERKQLIISKNINLDFFPYCMRSLYDRLYAGEKINHSERFALATFLVQIGMPIESIIDLFKHAPNFNERITRYQVERIKQKKYFSPSCNTLREQGIACNNCNSKSPVQYYKKQVWLNEKVK